MTTTCPRSRPCISSGRPVARWDLGRDPRAARTRGDHHGLRDERGDGVDHRDPAGRSPGPAAHDERAAAGRRGRRDPATRGRLAVYKVVDPETGAGPAGRLGRRAARARTGRHARLLRQARGDGRAFTDDGWLRTGDLGRLDDDDYLVLVGRNKDVYRCGGEQVVPKQVEDVLTTHPAVSQAHIVPLRTIAWERSVSPSRLQGRPDRHAGGARRLVRRAGREVQGPQACTADRRRRHPGHAERPAAQVPARGDGSPAAGHR